LAVCAGYASYAAAAAAKDGAPDGPMIRLLPSRSRGPGTMTTSILPPMSASAKQVPCLGFLTVVEHAELGLLGGYLLLNLAGRPLEFHCTAPVKPNRAQEILYGPTLRPFLYGEQIGQTLLARSKLTPLVACTDSESVLAARDFTETPLVLVREGEAAELRSFRLGRNHVTATPGYGSDQQAILAAWPAQADHLDLCEPFVRIREALEEAQKAARAA